ncbi:L-seryl-tRNA(Sec) selenium transferase [bacterium]|nr:L-seryl-tRNA(Sec) selenium transferase [candidate division CSSED10-310 bacterium]
MDYSKIPPVNTLLECSEFKPLTEQYGWTLTRNCLRRVLDLKRKGFGSLQPNDLTPGTLAEQTLLDIAASLKCSLKRVINATGTVLHTNLGRAPMARAALDAVIEVATGYCNLEMNLDSGLRGHRTEGINQTVAVLTGAEAAMAVNNNAGAVLLALTALAAGKEVIVSRGELIEIGGGFRIPEVIESGGAILKEVGTTNRTHLRDYVAALSDETGLIMKTSTSNYAILGFTAEVPIAELIELGARHSIPVLYDLGSGNFYNNEDAGWYSPVVPDLIEMGVDIVTFSGDKLLGGPQAGIIAGRKKWLDKIVTHPLTRALRLDKMTLAALDATLKLYLQPELVRERIPCLQALCESADTLQIRADVIANALKSNLPGSIELHVESDRAAVGGGSLPLTELPTWAVILRSSSIGATMIAEMLRRSEPPVITRIRKDAVVMDVRTISEPDVRDCIRSVIRALNGHPGGTAL